ncbi:hypothetical protein [Gordonia phthalatica]|uniref:Uncharacterized protein n=1 Tax=Gordonia phthalatica TaxID=1136941 RepID=A0A0N9N2U5_9ACTN|nr:hypothetical protein [Gordonia phthalatica]ALG84972.1 hypothetical protein ACH46_11290 [Gordonia phthalatica]
MSIKPRPTHHYRTFLTCYEDTLNYGWHHVDLFVHDEHDREVNWVHWTVEADGPEAADASVRAEEPDLRRTSPWEHRVSAAGVNYWTADATWGEPEVAAG